MGMLQSIGKKVMLAGVLLLVGTARESVPVFAAEVPAKPEVEHSVSENSVSENSTTAQEDVSEKDGDQEKDGSEETAVQPETPSEEEEVAQEEKEPVAVSADQFQTINYNQGILTDWQQVLEALGTLTPEALNGAGAGDKALVLQLQNVGNIPAEVKDSIGSGESGHTKILQCGLGSGVSLVLNGSADNSGFRGISNTCVSVASEKRGKKSIAATVRFASHEEIGAVVSLQVNLPQCSKGTKVSVYAETVAVDEEGNVTVGENACIGTTKAGENGNVEIPIQSTANYMFVYKGAKE